MSNVPRRRCGWCGRLINRMTEADDDALSMIERISELLEAWDASSSDIPSSKASLVARAALRGDFEGSLPNLVRAAHAAASVIRDRFSPDAWRALNDLVAVIVARLPAGPSEASMLERVEQALRIISSFSGLAQGEHDAARRAGVSSSSAAGSSGRSRPAASSISSPTRPAPDAALDVLLELCDSQITYRQRYIMIAARAPVIDLVAARSEQSALGRLPVRPYRGASRRLAEAYAPMAGCRGRSRSRRLPPPRCTPPTPPTSTTALILPDRGCGL